MFSVLTNNLTCVYVYIKKSKGKPRLDAYKIYWTYKNRLQSKANACLSLTHHLQSHFALKKSRTFSIIKCMNHVVNARSKFNLV